MTLTDKINYSTTNDSPSNPGKSNELRRYYIRRRSRSSATREPLVAISE